MFQRMYLSSMTNYTQSKTTEEILVSKLLFSDEKGRVFIVEYLVGKQVSRCSYLTPTAEQICSMVLSF